MREKGKHLTYTERQIIERMYNNGFSKKDIAKMIGCHVDTIYKELKLGYYQHLNHDYTYRLRYCAQRAQQKHDYNATAKGAPLKIGNDYEIAKYIERKIIKEKYSPYAVLTEIKIETGMIPFCTSTLYSYIDKGVFEKLTNKDLPEKMRRKRNYKKVKIAKRPPKGKSIEQRPKEINARKTIGHWEMDTVHGKAKGKGETILVLTERKTRHEIMMKLKGNTSKEVVNALDRLEKQCDFKQVFKTITVDNGSEFMDDFGMEHSRNGDKRTQVYYCHPYTSSERGSNERNNRIIRRFKPKGQSLCKCTNNELEYIQTWMNRYPRKLLGGSTAELKFLAELSEKNIYWNFRNTT